MSLGEPDEPAEGLIEEILAAEPTAAPHGEGSELLTFLIADIRGYTTFTHDRGDEAAAQLTAKFASIVRELVAQFGGTVFELRGDEALCVFPSPRQSLRLAIALQQRFVEEMTADPRLPLAVGIGVDAGEAVRGADGYRGGALNLAARLCSRAKAGEVLASQEVTHLARRIDGLRYVPGESVALKGLSEPVRLVRVLPEDEDPATRIAALIAASAPAPPATVPVSRLRRLRSRKVAIGAALLAALVAVSVVVLVRQHDSGSGSRLKAFGENSIGVIDPSSGKLVGQVAVDTSPSAAASGLGAVWTANTGGNSVSRIDPSSRQVVDRIQVGSAPSAVAVGLGAVWVANSGSGTVSRIDPHTGNTETISGLSAPGGLVVAFNAVWVTNTSNGTVSRIDPSQNEVTKTITVGEGPSGIAAGKDIWVANSVSNTVSEIDPVSSAVTTIHVGNDPRDVVVVNHDVWVTSNLDGKVARIPESGTSVTDSVTVGADPTKLTEVAGELWVATQADREIVEVDPAAKRRGLVVHVGATPTALVGANDQLWVTTYIDPTLHTGGTLRIAGREPLSVDPAYMETAWTIWLLNGSYDGLVGYRHANGAAGTAVVPDLATAIPEPTNGGRTYTFTLRKGVRWSTGAPVTVLDVQRGLLRSIAGGSPGLRQEIVGAGDCATTHCTVSGISVDAAASTVSITLVRPSADFLKLLPFAMAVPADTPLANQHRKPIPATGPYEIASDNGKLVVLKRNKYFKQWSADAQPSGFPDEIDYSIVPNDDPMISAKRIADGDADWADVRGAAPLGVLQTRFAGRLYVSPTETSHGAFLNTNVAPFDDIRVRRALAYAVDRETVSSNWFTPAEVTCQLLPPNFPGYRPYCPYTLPAATPGTWRAPDYPAAQRLVDASHTKGMRVVVLASTNTAPGMQSVVDALNELGYGAKLSIRDTPDYFQFLADSRNRFQAAFGGWVADIPDADDFVRPFTCAAFIPASQANSNIPELCDPVLDRLRAKAVRAETSSPAAAADLWAAADKRLVNEAPWIGLVTPSWVDAVSKRVHNYERSSVLGVYFGQMWVR